MSDLPVAQDPTPEEADDARRQAFRVNESIKSALGEGRKAGWQLAAALYAFEEQRGWQWLNYDTLGEWLADPDIGITRTTYFRLVGLHRHLVVSGRVPPAGLSELDPTKVDVVLPAVRRGRVSLDDALEDSKALARRDLREKYMGVRDEDLPGGADGDADATDGNGAGSVSGEVVDGATGPRALSEDMEGVIARDEVLEAMDSAIAELEQARDSGQSDPRVTHEQLDLVLFDLRVRGERDLALMEQLLTAGPGATNGGDE